MHKPWKGFVFPDVNSNLLDQPHDLGYGLTLRKATISELTERNVEWAFRMWSERRGSSVFLNQRMPFEDGKGVSGSVLPNPSEWRHAVIECTEGDVLFWWVNVAFAISAADLRMGLVSFTDGGESSPYVEFPMLNVRSPLGAMFVDYRLPGVDDLPQIRENLSLILGNVFGGVTSKEVANVIHIFLSLDNLSDSAPLKILGYFSVIEGLLSHVPQQSDRVDSIQRQLIRNINLLNNRLRKINRGIDFSAFGQTKIENVLGKLYGYRSAVAHGGAAQGAIAEIAKAATAGAPKTVDQLWIHDWVRNLTKKLILAAIVEPELVRDLK